MGQLLKWSIMKFGSAPWCFWDKRLDRGRGSDDLPVYIATDRHVACLNKVTLVILCLQI